MISQFLNETTLWWLAGFSAVMFVGTLIAIPWLVVRIPSDYFSRDRRGRPVLLATHPVLRAISRIAANVLGLVLVIAGIAMLVLPGQGILTVLVGLLVMNFPGKYRLERWLVSFESVLSAINAMRRRAGRQPLTVPEEGA